MYPHVAWCFFIGQMFLLRSILFIPCSYIYWKLPTLQMSNFMLLMLSLMHHQRFNCQGYLIHKQLVWLVCGMKLGAVAKGDFSGIVGSVLSFQWGVHYLDYVTVFNKWSSKINVKWTHWSFEIVPGQCFWSCQYVGMGGTDHGTSCLLLKTCCCISCTWKYIDKSYTSNEEIYPLKQVWSKSLLEWPPSLLQFCSTTLQGWKFWWTFQM